MPAHDVFRGAQEISTMPNDIADVALSHDGDLGRSDPFPARYHLGSTPPGASDTLQECQASLPLSTELVGVIVQSPRGADTMST